jgi:hypothetical protein
MALSIFKSTDEVPWDRFSNRLARILRSESGGFTRRHHRTVALGSPVKITEAGSDLIRIPLEVRGGPREYAIAYLHVRHMDNKLDERRLQSIVEEAIRAADAHPASPPADPGALVLTYP